MPNNTTSPNVNQYDNIPLELKDLPQWVGFAIEIVKGKDGKDEKRKIPKNPKTGGNAMVNKPETWGTFEEACNGRKIYKYQHIGFAFTKEDPYCGIDIDDCVGPNKTLSNIAQEILTPFIGTYSEFSASGNGIHIISKGKTPEQGRKIPELKIELYDASRFFVFTGNPLYKNSILELQEQINSLYEKHFNKKTAPNNVSHKQQELTLSDDEVIEKAKNARNGSKFLELYNGDTSGHNNDDSSADFSLCLHLAFWTKKNPEQIDRIFRNSGLFRKKWDDSNGYYGKRTIQKAIESCQNIYEDKKSINKFETSIQQIEKEAQETEKAIYVVQEEIKKLSHSLLEKEEPCANFNVKDLPKHLSEYIESIGETTEAHPIMIATSVISSLSGIIKKRLYMPRGEYFQKLHVNLWVANLYKSGGFKSTAMENGANIAREISRDVIREIKQVEAELRTSKIKKEDFESKRLEASLKDVILPNKITAEALLEHLSEGHSGIILTGELGAWLQNMEKNHNADLKAIFTELYDVPSSYRYKTKTQGDHILENPFFSIYGVSTLTWLKENLKPNDVSSGFFARFLLYTPPHVENYIPKALPWSTAQINSEAEKNIKETLSNMDSEYSYKFAPSAKLLFESTHVSLYNMVRGYSENCQVILDPYLKRWSPYLIKLAMIMRLFEDPTSKELSDTSINSATKILLPAIKSTALLFEGELGESEQQQKCRLIYEWIVKRISKNLPTTWAALISSRVLDGGAGMYEYHMKTLIEGGRIREIKKDNKKDCLYVPNTQ